VKDMMISTCKSDNVNQMPILHEQMLRGRFVGKVKVKGLQN